MRALKLMLIDSPSQIQEYIPEILADPPKNCIVQGPTGSGKTLAMAIAIVSRVDAKKKIPQVLCIIAKHEAAIQFGNTLSQICRCSKIKYELVLSGTEGENLFQFSSDHN